MDFAWTSDATKYQVLLPNMNLQTDPSNSNPSGKSQIVTTAGFGIIEPSGMKKVIWQVIFAETLKRSTCCSR